MKRTKTELLHSKWNENKTHTLQAHPHFEKGPNQTDPSTPEHVNINIKVGTKHTKFTTPLHHLNLRITHLTSPHPPTHTGTMHTPHHAIKTTQTRRSVLVTLTSETNCETGEEGVTYSSSKRRTTTTSPRFPLPQTPYQNLFAAR